MLTLGVNKDKSENVKYDYADFPLYVRKAPLSAFPNFAAESHWHDDIELIAVLSGQTQYNVNGEIVELSEGEGIIVNARQIHYSFSDSKSECVFICILFHPMLICTTKSFENNYVKQIYTDMTILEISLAVGFSGASYYSETFRKHFGKSPAEYRKLKVSDDI